MFRFRLQSIKSSVSGAKVNSIQSVLVTLSVVEIKVNPFASGELGKEFGRCFYSHGRSLGTCTNRLLASWVEK